MYVDLSTSQYIPFGKMLGHLYYQNQALLALAPGRNGYPHNGGEHTLSLCGTKEDINAFLDLVTEKYPYVLCEATKIQMAVREWKEGDPILKAKKLFSQHIYDYHKTYQYKVLEDIVHFYPRPGFTHQEFALEAICHLELITGWAIDDLQIDTAGIVHFDDFMTVEIFRRDTTESYRARIQKEHAGIAALYGDSE
jgi:hypothetical protein